MQVSDISKMLTCLTRTRLRTNGVRVILSVSMCSISYRTLCSVAEIISECPWFLEMRDLIAERPNLIPTGIGNSATINGIDLAILQEDHEIETEGDTEPGDGTSDGILHDEVAREIEGSTSDADETSSVTMRVHRLVYIFVYQGNRNHQLLVYVAHHYQETEGNIFRHRNLGCQENECATRNI